MSDCLFVIEEINSDSYDDNMLNKISSIHQQVLKNGFLSSLGNSFLKSIYRELAIDSHSCLLCVLQDNTVAGFICGTTNTSVFYKRYLRRNFLRSCFALLPKISSFKFLKRIVETLAIPTQTKKIELPPAQLLNFCVSDQCQGNGIGTLLFDNLMLWFHRNNISEVTIITGKEQVSAQRFYKKQGLREQTKVTIHDNSESVVFICDLEKSPIISRNKI